MAERSSLERPTKETEFMINGGKRINRRNGLVLALLGAVLSACATAGAGDPAVVGERPRDDADTRQAGVYIAQASLMEGDEALRTFERALASALSAIERDPTNPRAFLLAGQAAIGAREWEQADTMLIRAKELHPGFADQIRAEREEGWVIAYNLGAEAMSAGEMAAALESFSAADRLFQERPEARMALAILYANEGNTSEAIRAYRGALEILAQPTPEGIDEEQLAGWETDRQMIVFNLANLLAQEERYGEAADELDQFLRGSGADLDRETQLQALTARAAFLAQAGRADEAEGIYGELLDRPDLGADQHFQIGIGLFNAGEYERAAESFATAARLNPHSRDAHLNLVQSLYTAALDLEQEPQTAQRDARLREMYEELLAAADRVGEFDPLNRNLLSFRLRAYRAKADLAPQAEADQLMRRSQEVFRQYQQQEYEVADITMAQEPGDRARIEGVLTNLSGTPGQRVGLRFTILDADGNALDTATADVTVPGVEEATRFSTSVSTARGDLAGWRYELVR
jgi:Flp pilus assembly protein TadD